MKINNTVENSFDSDKKAKNSRSRHQVGKDKIDTRREDGTRRLTKIINACTNSITKAINDLAEEVWDLEAQLSDTTKERDDLVETVNSLNAKLSIIHPMEKHVDTHLDSAKLDCPEVVIPDSEEQDLVLEAYKMSNESGDHQEHEVMSDTEDNQTEKYTIKQKNRQ